VAKVMDMRKPIHLLASFELFISEAQTQTGGREWCSSPPYEFQLPA